MDKRNKIRRFLAIVAVLASLLVVVTIFLRTRHGDAAKVAGPKLPLQVDVSLQKVHYTEMKGGQKRWDLSADRAEYDKGADTTSLTGVSFTVAGGAATGELQVTADRAVYHNGSKDVVLDGNVHGQSKKGIEFSAPRVAYVASRSQLETSDRVRLVDGGLELEGVGMEFQTQNRRFRLMKDVSAVYRQQGAR